MKFITRVVLLAAALVLPALASAGTYVSITVAPPPLPVYVQPVCPGDGYIWTPGYWAWDGDEYYWVPGVWVLAPAIDVFWTPGYWGWVGGYYTWHTGYWGPHVGFYGGVNYGFGYNGVGYVGGRWEGGSFRYNRAVNNINMVNIHNSYNTVVVNHNSSRVSFNGGDHGTRAQPTAREISAQRDHHFGATDMQEQHSQAAHEDRSMRFSQNGGHPPNTGTSHSFSSGSSGERPAMKAPENSSRAAQGHMPSSGFAPHHGNNVSRSGPRESRENGVVIDRGATSDGGEMPSSSSGPRERQQNQGGMRQERMRQENMRQQEMRREGMRQENMHQQEMRQEEMRQEAPRAMNPNMMNGPARERMGGGEGRRNEGPRPQQEHHRQER